MCPSELGGKLGASVSVASALSQMLSLKFSILNGVCTWLFCSEYSNLHWRLLHSELGNGQNQEKIKCLMLLLLCIWNIPEHVASMGVSVVKHGCGSVLHGIVKYLTFCSLESWKLGRWHLRVQVGVGRGWRILRTRLSWARHLLRDERSAAGCRVLL